MVSFRMESEEAAVRVCERTKLFTLGESLGGVESLIEHPGRMTHASAAARRWRSPRTSCGCRSGSRTRATCSGIWTGRSAENQLTIPRRP